MNIILYPLDRVDLDGKTITLGMKRAAVEEVLGAGECVRKRQYFFNSEMVIYYDAGANVEFVEFLGGVDGALRPVIYGVSAFDTDAEELVEILRRENDGAVDDLEQGHCCVFRNISVGVYRELTPEDISESLEEMRAEEIEPNEDFETDKKRAGRWATIGIGVAGYYG